MSKALGRKGGYKVYPGKKGTRSALVALPSEVQDELFVKEGDHVFYGVNDRREVVITSVPVEVPAGEETRRRVED